MEGGGLAGAAGGLASTAADEVGELSKVDEEEVGDSISEEVVEGEGTGTKVVATEGSDGDWKISPRLVDLAVLSAAVAEEGMVEVESVSTCCSWSRADVVGMARLVAALEEVAVMGTDDGRGGGASGVGERVESSQAVIQPS